MRFVRSVAAALLAASLSAGCYATYSGEVVADEYHPQTGVVESVHQVVRRYHGNPAGGAAAGALLGAVLLGGNGPRTLFGAAAGAATGAALSSGDYETVTYDVVVRFDNGSRGVFTYRNAAPFAPGERLALDPDGHPHRIGY